MSGNAAASFAGRSGSTKCGAGALNGGACADNPAANIAQPAPTPTRRIQLPRVALQSGIRQSMLVLSVLGLGRPMPDGESPIFRLKAEATDRCDVGSYRSVRRNGRSSYRRAR